MRKLKYHVACTVDGYIAREDGSFDGFLPEGEHVTDYLESFQTYDIVLMGRKTYEVGLKLGVTNPYPMMKSYVFSRTLTESLDENVTIVSKNIIELVRELKNESDKDIYLCGGAELATMLFREQLIDEIVLKLNPLLYGSGIPLFSGVILQTDLELISSKIYENGVVLLQYEVKY
jgi:dihydrofolate reductase